MDEMGSNPVQCRKYGNATKEAAVFGKNNLEGIDPELSCANRTNVSSEPAVILFFFNKPAFEKCLRAMSSRPGETFTMPETEKMAAVRTECHEVMKQ
jgi:hypothetical protein